MHKHREEGAVYWQSILPGDARELCSSASMCAEGIYGCIRTGYCKEGITLAMFLCPLNKQGERFESFYEDRSSA